MNEFQDKHYFIKDAANMAGLSEQLIRKWESRYQIVQPKRLDNGYRIYSLDDILILKKIRELRDQGSSIKHAIDGVLSNINTKKREHMLNEIDKSPYVERLINKGKVYDEEGLVFLLKQSHHQYGLDLFLQNTVQPFLKQIGLMWENGKWDESQETVSSLVVKDFLTQISRNFENNLQASHVLGISVPDEYHEIPLQILLLQMKVRGWRTTRIGSSSKLSSIEKLVERIKPQKVIFSATTMIPFQKAESLFKDLDAIAKRHSHINFYIGGRGVWDYTEIIKPKYMNISYTVDDIINE